jgi:hypothetical protein
MTPELMKLPTTLNHIWTKQNLSTGDSQHERALLNLSVSLSQRFSSSKSRTFKRKLYCHQEKMVARLLTLSYSPTYPKSSILHIPLVLPSKSNEIPPSSYSLLGHVQQATGREITLHLFPIGVAWQAGSVERLSLARKIRYKRGAGRSGRLALTVNDRNEREWAPKDKK